MLIYQSPLDYFRIHLTIETTKRSNSNILVPLVEFNMASLMFANPFLFSIFPISVITVFTNQGSPFDKQEHEGINILVSNVKVKYIWVKSPSFALMKITI